MAPKSAPRPSQECLERVSGRPWNAPPEPGESPRSPRGTKRSAREHPGACRGDENRGCVALGMEHIELGRFFDEMARFSALSLCVQTLRSTAPANKNEDSAHRAARRVAYTISPRKMTKIDPGINNFECIWPQGGIGFRCFESLRQSNNVGFDSFRRTASKRLFQVPAREARGPLSVPSKVKSSRRSEALCRSICIDIY